MWAKSKAWLCSRMRCEGVDVSSVPFFNLMIEVTEIQRQAYFTLCPQKMYLFVQHIPLVTIYLLKKGVESKMFVIHVSLLPHFVGSQCPPPPAPFKKSVFQEECL